LMKKKVPLKVGKCSSQMRAKVSDDEQIPVYLEAVSGPINTPEG
jgi:hypothetical protein